MALKFVLLAAVAVAQINAHFLLPPPPPAPPAPPAPCGPAPPPSSCVAFKHLLKHLKSSTGVFCPPGDSPSWPTIPGWPSYPGWPSTPGYPGYPGYPSYPGYPIHPVYPEYPSKPSYPAYPSEPAPQIDQKPDVTIPLPLPPSIDLGNFCTCQKYTIKPSLLPGGSPSYPVPDCD